MSLKSKRKQSLNTHSEHLDNKSWKDKNAYDTENKNVNYDKENTLINNKEKVEW